MPESKRIGLYFLNFDGIIELLIESFLNRLWFNKNMKRWLFLGIFIVLISSLVIAQTSGFDEEKSYSWLKTKIGSWETNDVSTIAFAMLAMINHGDDVSGGIAKLRSLEHATHCWPNSGCEVVDSALANLALYKAGEDVSGGIAWLENQDGALNPALSADKWELEIISSGEGSCKLTYGSNQIKTVQIKDGLMDGKWSTIAPWGYRNITN